VECAPRDPEARRRLAAVLDANDLLDEAAPAWESVVRLAPEDARGWYHLGRTAAELGDAERALDALARAGELAPDYAPAAWRAGAVALRLDRLDEAERSFERARALDPEEWAAWTGLARVALQRRDPARAAELLQAGLATLPPLSYAVALHARAVRERDGTPEAGPAAGTAAGFAEPIWRDPWVEELLPLATGYRNALQRADQLLQAGRAQLALDLLLPFAEADERDVTVQSMVTAAYVQQRDFARALACVEAAQRHHPQHYRLALNRGLILRMQGRSSVAREELERAVELNPGHGPSLAALGQLLVDCGEHERAGELLAEALRQGEGGAALFEAEARARAALADWSGASESFARAAAERPGDAAAWARLAQALARAGRADEARSSLDRARSIDGSLPLVAEVEAELSAFPGEPAGRGR